MSVLNKLASANDRRDEQPNIELAKKIAFEKDVLSVKDLIEGLSNKSKDIQNDCIKVLYEIGALNPKLISEFLEVFLNLLDHKNNRLQWGAMTAISCIVVEDLEEVNKNLAKIIASADKGSVITKDACVAILIKLCTFKKYEEAAFTLLNERILKSPTNQLPMYAENSVSIVKEKNKATLVKTLTVRLSEIEKESKRKRVEKVIKRLQK